MKRSAKRSKTHVKATTKRCQFLAHIGAHNLLRDKVLCLKLKRVDNPQTTARATEAMKKPGGSEVGNRKTTISDVKTLCPKRVVVKLARLTVADTSKKASVKKRAPPKFPSDAELGRCKRRRTRQI